MLEVMEKADRLHVDQPMRRSMGEASTSDDSSIRFNEVTRQRLCLLVGASPTATALLQ